MATAADCIKLALRKLRVIGQGENPSSAQQTDALLELNHLLRDWSENGVSWPYVNEAITGSYEVSAKYPSLRLQCLNGGITVTLPDPDNREIPDGMRLQIVDVTGAFASSPVTLARNGWELEGAAANLTLNTAGLVRTWVFRADLGDWRRLADLGTSDLLPYPTDFDYGIALILAQRLEGEYGQPLGPSDAKAAKQAKIDLYARYVRPTDVNFDPSSQYMGGRSKIYGFWDFGSGQ